MEPFSDDGQSSTKHANRPSKRRRPTHEPPAATNGDDSRIRIRVTQACNECRKRKDRCDGARPACSRCVSCNRPCCYNKSNKKRGLRGGYVRTLEILLGLIFNTVEGSETWVAAILANKTTTPSFHLRLAPEFAKDAAETSLGLWRRSHVLAEIERLGMFASPGADEDESSDRLNDRLSESLANFAAVFQGQRAVVGPSTVDAQQLLAPAVEQGPDFEGHVSDLVQDPMILDDLIPQMNITSSTRPPPGGFVGSQAEASNDDFPLPIDWQALLDKYFQTTHSWLPLAEKHELLRISYSLHATEASVSGPTAPSRGDNAFLAAAFAYVMNREQRNCHDQVKSIRDEEMLRLSSFTNKLLDLPEDTYELGHVRALLLLTLGHIDDGKWDQGRRSVGRAVYMMVNLMDINDTQTASVEESRKRTLLGCFALGHLLAIRLKRRTYVNYSDVQKLGLLSKNTVEEWEPWHVDHSTGSGTDGR